MNLTTKRITWGLGLIAAIAAAIGAYLADNPVPVETYTPPAAITQQGWAGPEAVKLSEPFALAQPKFELTDELGRPIVQDNERSVVRQWDALRQVLGEVPPVVPQEIGDCTSHGGKHAIERHHACLIVGGQNTSWRPISAMYLYGVGRHDILHDQLRFRGDGCTGAAIAEAAKTGGVCPSDLPGFPAYNGRDAKKWGDYGPPDQWRIEAAKYKVKTVALARSAKDVRDALNNGYGVTEASSWGNPKHQYKRIDGRWVGQRSGVWMHQMCIDGYDGLAASGPKYHIQNSWPDSQHPEPIDGSPRGGFWVEEADVEFMVRANDTWIYSSFDGFPIKPLDIPVFGAAADPTRVAAADRKTTLSF